MTATDTNTDEADKVIDRCADDYGTRRSQLPGVDAGTMSVELPEHFAAEHVSVCGYNYDDEPGDVELTIGDAVHVGVWLDPDGARELAEQLRIAADEADEQIAEEA